jgi:hypothetical protein
MLGYYNQFNQSLSREIHEIQQQRVRSQERFFPQFQKYANKKHESTVRKIQCDQAAQNMIDSLANHGFDYLEHKKEMKMVAMEQELKDAHDPRFDNTIREYEAVTIEDENSGEESEHKNKKLRYL